MKIFTAGQIYKADKYTTGSQQIGSNELMERAAVKIFNWIHLRMQGYRVKIHLFCGIGNNGGDGIALARHLQEHGYNIGVYVVNYSDKRSKDFLINLTKIKDREIWPDFINSDTTTFPKIHKDDIIVDAIFGIGLNREPSVWVVKLIQHLNNSSAFILSVDISSGLFMNKSPADSKAVVKAKYVLSFQVPKIVFFLPQTAIYSDKWEIMDIGLDKEYIRQTETVFQLIDKNEVQPLYIAREKFSHKGTYGHSLIIGGSYGKIGAVSLASKSCLHSGSGLVTSFVPGCGYIPLQTALPELMVITDIDEKNITKIQYDIVPNVIGIGIGMGKEEVTVKAFSEFLKNNKTPLVLDADALNILAKNKQLLKNLPKASILTPHPKELERLIGVWKDDFDKLDKAIEFSKKYDCILVIKGAHTITIYKGKGYINTTGNSAMATAGSGDVLTGIITALIAQGYTLLNAAIFGVYLHGKSGDIAVEKRGYESLTASRLIDCIGKAYMCFSTQN